MTYETAAEEYLRTIPPEELEALSISITHIERLQEMKTMYPGAPGTEKSYRLGDFAGQGGGLPIGTYVVKIISFSPTKSKDGHPQLKTESVCIDAGPESGKKHSWWNSLNDDALWSLFQNLIRAGFDSNYNPGPPGDGSGYIAVFGPHLIGHVFQIGVKPGKDTRYTNTEILSRIQVGPDGQPVAFAPAAQAPPYQPPAPAASAPAGYPGSPAGWPVPAPQGTPTSPTGPAHGVPAQNVPQGQQYGSVPPPMTAYPQPSQYAPQPGGSAMPVPAQLTPPPPMPPAQPGPPNGMVDTTSLFRQA